MLENIKSSSVINNIFRYLYEKKKLELIKYNKDIQKQINVNIINYKHLSETFIIYEESSKGKEYDSDGKLIFEGEFLHGKRNGKGKEYDSYHGKLIFEGEYLNGKRNGKGKKYDLDGSLTFEGEYLNGDIWNGKGYDKNKKIVYEFINGNGIIKEYYDGYLFYECEYLNGKPNGKLKKYSMNI